MCVYVYVRMSEKEGGGEREREREHRHGVLEEGKEEIESFWCMSCRLKAGSGCDIAGGDSG